MLIKQAAQQKIGVFFGVVKKRQMFGRDSARGHAKSPHIIHRCFISDIGN